MSVERFRLLLSKLRSDHIASNGRERGWVNSVAQELGCSGPLISAVSKGNKGVGPRIIEAAMNRYSLPPAFFLAASFDAPAFLAGDISGDEADQESYVVPVFEHPYEASIRAFEKRHGHRFSPEIMQMIRSSAAGRRGLSEGMLLDLAIRLTEVEEEVLRRRLGPPE